MSSYRCCELQSLHDWLLAPGYLPNDAGKSLCRSSSSASRRHLVYADHC